MGTPSTFRYSFINSDYTGWYYVDAAGDVKVSPSPKYMTDNALTLPETVSPSDWRGTLIGVARNEKYMGVFSKFGAPLNFTYEAAKILRHIDAYDGPDGIVYLIIEARQPDWTYRKVYESQVNLSDLKGATTKKERLCQATLDEEGIEAKLKSKEDTMFEIPFDGDAITINNDGMRLQSSMSWVAGSSSGVPYAVKANERLYIDSGYVGTDASPYLASFLYPSSQTVHLSANDDNSKLLVGYVDSLVECEFDFDIEVSAGNLVVGGVQIQVVLDQRAFPCPSGAYTMTNNVLYISPSQYVKPGTSKRIQRKGTFSWVMPKDTLLKLRVNGSNSSTASNQNVGVTIYKFDLKLKTTSRLPSTTHLGYPRLTFLNKLFKLALGNNVNVLSNYLNTDQILRDTFDLNPKWVCVTSGDALRGIANPKIKTSIAEAFRDLRAEGLGLGVEGTNIRIEPLKYFMQPNKVITRLTNVVSVKDSWAKDWMANKIVVGYAPKVYDDLNGKYDFFGKNEYDFPTDKISNDLDLSSNYYASPWAVEYARMLGVAKKDSTDSQYDNDTFLIQTESTPTNGAYNILRRPGSKLGMIFPDDVYNFGLSPATRMHLNADYLLSLGYGRLLRENYGITWQTTSKNANFIRTLDSITIGENSAIMLQDLARKPDGSVREPLFTPKIIEIEATISEDVLQELKKPNDTKCGVIEFEHPKTSEIFSIFVLDAGYYVETKDLYVIRGMLIPNSNVSGLI